MEVKKLEENYNAAAALLSPETAKRFTEIPDNLKARATELRVRQGRKLCVCLVNTDENICKDEYLYIDYIPDKHDMEECIKQLCGMSVHSHRHEIVKGFISLPGGHRAGICGTAVVDAAEEITALRDISSVNLRIARQVSGAADDVVERIINSEKCGVLIAGPPGSGKTTLLREICRLLASERCGYKKVAVIDERAEIAAVSGGVPGFDVGESSDILTGYPKAAGMLTAVRTLSPEYIIADELGTVEETQAVRACMGTGAQVIASIHAGSIPELLSRPQTKFIIEQNLFEKIFFISAPGGRIKFVQGGKDFEFKNIGRTVGGCVVHAGR